MDSIELERRWLVSDVEAAIAGHHPLMVAQAYPFVSNGWCVRVRRTFQLGPDRETTEGSAHNMLAIKGPRTGPARLELQWELPVDAAIALYRLAAHKVVKSRYSIVHGGRLWDVDVFHHDNEGLAIAECEFSPGDADITPAPWCGTEVTNDRRYDNDELAQRPFRTW